MRQLCSLVSSPLSPVSCCCLSVCLSLIGSQSTSVPVHTRGVHIVFYVFSIFIFSFSTFFPFFFDRSHSMISSQPSSSPSSPPFFFFFYYLGGLSHQTSCCTNIFFFCIVDNFSKTVELFETCLCCNTSRKDNNIRNPSAPTS